MVAFFAEGRLKKIDPSGGPPQTLCDLPDGTFVGTWGRGGTILISHRGNDFSGIYRVPDTGGAPTLVMRLNDESRMWMWPIFLPDGRHFLYSAVSDQAQGNGIYIGSVDSDVRQLLVEARSRVEYTPGYLLYAREGSLFAQRFDTATLRVTGDPFVVVDQLAYFDLTGWAEFSVSETGVLVYRPNVSRITRLAWFDRNGREVGQAGPPDAYDDFRLSPNGQKIVVALKDDLWSRELARDTRTRLTFSSKSNGNPVLSPDGRIAFFAPRGHDKSTLYMKDLSDTGDGESPLPAGFQTPDDWSLDGKFIVYTQREDKTAYDLWILPVSGDRKPILFLRTPFNEENARFSPDGKWIAYVSDESGGREVYVRHVEDPRQRWKISTAGGTRPLWRRDGKELYYLGLDNQVMKVSIQSGTGVFDAGVPVALFRIESPGWNGGGEDTNAYNVTPDGERFLVQLSVAESQSPAFAVIINWTAELKQ